ncbi:hypothetical protein JDW15_04340 [Aerococcaceae bacterium zg-ZJ1578]|uniref:hypothetical protein n=1 Tax=Aerococcaceae bacterium zg-252 TaxID=2796928 RepID=UPI001A2604AB|nr:hypothetical protein [Aerococcaceae bacterium zg-1578]
MQITDNLRIKRLDDKNLVLEQYVDSVHPKTKAVTKKWKFVGYFGSVRSALQCVVEREMLIDINALDTLEKYVETLQSVSKMIVERCGGETK